MQKEKSVLSGFLVCIFLILFSLSFVTTQENNSSTGFSDDVELEADAGLVPGDFFYFLDSFFDGFGDDIKVKEEKVAEIKSLIEEGKYKEAQKSLEKYRNLADKLEKEINPGRENDAKRSAAAIRKAVLELEADTPEEMREDFIEGVLEKENAVVTSVEIASKIKDLCQQLSEIDPLEYSRVCRTNEDAPKWQKQLDEDLTDKQREEAKKFGRIMQQCFETAGQQCACEEIPFTEFAETCSIAAPLATACEIDGNKGACEQLDNIEMPELPLHLQDVFDDLEHDVTEAQFGLHMPEECREAGATSPRECMKIMIQVHAPEECRDALIKKDARNEKEAREICEKIIFEQNAPQECIDAGIRDPRECGVVMFRQNAPQECIEAGLTGEQRSDHKKCEELMNSLHKERGPGERRGPGFGGANCRSIENPEERLACYDGAVGSVQEYKGEFEERFREEQEEIQDRMEQCIESCGNRPWDFTGGQCTCGEEGQHYDKERGFYDESECKDGCSQECPGASRTDCVNDRCECFYDGEESNTNTDTTTTTTETESAGSDEETTTTTESTDTTTGSTSEETTTTTTTEKTTTTTESTDTTTESSSDSSTSTESSEPPSEPDALATGAVITGNAFLDYYYRHR